MTLTQALLFVEGFGRRKRCACARCWGSAPKPLYVHQKLQTAAYGQSESASSSAHTLQPLAESQLDLQFALLRQHAGLEPPSLTAVETFRWSPFALDVHLGWSVGFLLAVEALRRFVGDASRLERKGDDWRGLRWTLPNSRLLTALASGPKRRLARRLLRQLQLSAVSFAEQLEAGGFWEAAVAVLLVAPDSRESLALWPSRGSCSASPLAERPLSPFVSFGFAGEGAACAKQVLLRRAEELNTGKGNSARALALRLFLEETLGVPPFWTLEARALSLLHRGFALEVRDWTCLFVIVV